MVFKIQTEKKVIRFSVALLCIAALVLTASAATGRSPTVGVQPAVVNVSPQATQVVQPAADRVLVVTTTPVPQRTAVVTTLPTTVPVVNVQRSLAVVTPVTTQPTQQPLVVQARVANATISTTGSGQAAKVGTAEARQLAVVNTADITRGSLQETTTGYRDPRTGEVLSPDAHPGSGLPGGKDISKELPSGEERAKDLGKGVLGGGSDYIGEGTPFDSKPGSNSLDGFLSQHGGNLPDPLEAFGKGRSGFSPAQDAPGSTDSSKSTVTVGEISFSDGTTSVVCGSDYVGVESTKQMGGDECYVIQFDGSGNFKTEADRKNAVDLILKWVPKQSGDQQYEGEGGYVGGGGHSANDLSIGSTGRMTGKVVGGTDPGEAGLGKDTGGKTPAVFEAIGKYIASGGKVRGVSGGYQTEDSGQGLDIGGTGESRISGLKKALSAQRFIIDPNAQYAEQVPWWMEKVVSPNEVASAAQVRALQAGAVGAAAQNAEAGTAQTK